MRNSKGQFVKGTKNTSKNYYIAMEKRSGVRLKPQKEEIVFCECGCGSLIDWVERMEDFIDTLLKKQRAELENKMKDNCDSLLD